jgi:HEAT repeat protein
LDFSLDQAHESKLIATTLGRIGPAASEAAPALVRQLFWSDEYDDEKETRTALLRIGPDALPALVKGLDTFGDEEGHCVRILEVIGQFGAKADSAVPAVLPLCRDERRDLRAAAARALAEIHSSAKIVIPELLRLLTDVRPLVRAQAAQSLASIKTASSPGVAALTTALEDEYIDVRTEAAEALGSIGPSARPAIRALERATNDPSPLVRNAAKTALEKLY